MCADRELRDLAARWSSPMMEQGFCLRDPKGTFGCMSPHTAAQRTLVLVRRAELHWLAPMLKIHDHFDLKVGAELAAKAPGHLERGCAGIFLFLFFNSSTELEAPHCNSCCRIETPPGAGEQVQNRSLDSSSSALAAIWLDLSKDLSSLRRAVLSGLAIAPSSEPLSSECKDQAAPAAPL